MYSYTIVEVDDGYTIVEFEEHETAEDAALREGGILIDSGPYASYKDACDALENLDVLDEEDGLV